MRPKQPPIIAIHATSRGFGYVVMSAPFSLVDWGTHSATKNKNATLIAALDRLIARYDPHTLVFEDPTTEIPKRSARIKRLYRAIAADCLGRSVDLAVFPRADIHRCYASVGALTWQEIAETVGRQLEPLRNQVPPKRKAWQSEARRMSIFAAAAVAMTYWQLGAMKLGLDDA